MSLVTRAADTFYTFRFLTLLVMKWKDLDAYKFGIIDENGKVLRKSAELKSSEERAAYTLFHRLVFNIKRLIEKVPLGKTRIASYAAALYLIKECTDMSEERIIEIMEKLGIENEALTESKKWMLNESNALLPGRYVLATDCILKKTYEYRAKKGSEITVTEEISPIGFIAGNPIFKVIHEKTQQPIIISLEDITR